MFPQCFISLTLAVLPPFAAGAAPLVWNKGDALILNVLSSGFEPIAIRNAQGIYREVPMSDEKPEAVKEIVAQQFKPGTVLPFYQSGLKKGQLTLKDYSAAGCYGFGFVTAELNPPVHSKGESARSYPHHLAFSSGFPGTQVFNGLQPNTPAIEQAALQLSRTLYAKHGVKPADIQRLEVDDWQGLKLDKGQHQGLVISSRIPAKDQTYGACHTHSLLVIAEKQGPTYVPKLELFKEGGASAEDSCLGYSFLGTFQSGPEEQVALEGFGYEWNWYEIYRRTAQGNYNKVFSGGGGGC